MNTVASFTMHLVKPFSPHRSLMDVGGKAGRHMGVEEAALLRAARNGDDDAFGTLIQPCLDPSYRLALRIVDDPTEAEDAVQDALYKAWRALPGFRGDAKFSTWVYRIVWRECVDRTRRRESLLLEVDVVDANPTNDPEQRWEARETQTEVEHALRRLSVPYRTVLTLFYIEDLPMREIADILELPLGTIKTHLHRARNALRKVLSETESHGGRGRGNAFG